MTANASAYGFQLYRANSAPQPLEYCLLASGESNNVGKGDVVKTAGDAGSAGNGPNVKTVTLISAGDPCYGVVEAIDPMQVVSTSFSLDRTYRPASTAMYCYVRRINLEDEYRAMLDDVGGTLATADVGLNANITGNNGGTTITTCNTNTGVSTMMVDTSTKNTTATLQVNIKGFCNDANLSVGTASQSVIVTFNNVERSGGTGTVGQ